jgi:chromosome segregation and condensation protein ScpB
MRDLKLVEEFAGADGRLRFATTEAFLQRFGLASLRKLTAASLSGNPDKTPGTQPLSWVVRGVGTESYRLR